MILTTCAACAAPLAHNAPRCVRCHTRYCNKTCQHDHWRRGHKQICKRIHRGGNAEQYNADKKYKEAVAVAVEACADDTKGQTCFICTQALHWKTKEGLVRGCSCRGTAGFAHVSCLAEQAKILFAEAEENNLGWEAQQMRWDRWHTCSLCEQKYHGVVRCALGWACWKTYLGRPEADFARRLAMGLLSGGLSDANHHEDALSVREAELSMERRVGASEETMLIVQGNIASTYQSLGRIDQALQLEREIYTKRLESLGNLHPETLIGAICLANTLSKMHRYDEVRSFAPARIAECLRALGAEHENTLFLRTIYAHALSASDPEQAETILVDVTRIARRVLGPSHPRTSYAERSLSLAQKLGGERKHRGE